MAQSEARLYQGLRTRRFSWMPVREFQKNGNAKPIRRPSNLVSATRSMDSDALKIRSSCADSSTAKTLVFRNGPLDPP
jgi:hypothetical protein